MQEQVDQQWSTQRFVVIDFETTGIDPTSDRVVEMGIAVFEHGELVVAKSWLINPGMPVPPEVSAVHGITDEMLARAPAFAEVIAEALPLLDGAAPMAYNAPFDRAFLLAEWTRLERPAPAGIPALDPAQAWIDPLVWVRELQKYEKGKKLADAARRLRIELTNAHRAASDAEAAGRVMLALATRGAIGNRVPAHYDTLLERQAQLSEQQTADFAAWKARKGAA